MPALRLSARAHTMQASPIRKLLPLAEEAKRAGVVVHHLNIGQPDILSPKEYRDALAAAADPVIEYSKSQGRDDYLETVCRYYAKHRIDVKPSQAIITAGGSEAIIFAFLAITDPGDEILVFEPFYTNYNGFATIANIALKPILTRAENGFHLPPEEEIEAAIGPRTRGILICNPGNPTGTVLTDDELALLSRVALRRGLYLIADEVYREFVYDGRTHRSVMEDPDLHEHAIMVDSVSKRYSLCGARLGTVVTRNKNAYDLMVKFAQARLSAATPEQKAAVALGNVPDAYVAEIIREYQKRRDIVYDGVRAIPGALCLKPEGAFYVVVTLPVRDAEDFVKFMLKDFRRDGRTVMLAPAEGFYATPRLGRNQVRIAYILNEEKLRDAMEILREGFAEYLRRPDVAGYDE